MHNAFKGVGNDVKELAYYTIAFMQTTEQKVMISFFSSGLRSKTFDLVDLIYCGVKEEEITYLRLSQYAKNT